MIKIYILLFLCLSLVSSETTLKDLTEVGWRIEFVDKIYYGGSNDYTEFTYKLYYVDSLEKDLSHFVLVFDVNC